MRAVLSLTLSLPAAMKATLWTGLNMAPPKRPHMGPKMMSETTVMAMERGNSPKPVIWGLIRWL
jgi:hypothetical protein